ncbi:hypothetical protein RhiirC2_712365 [Rhizophagus irregularis]|uniref:Uncharacterized protein n=1 Tax=Rhizophagus irregularis TaxID=588596 RepID=A0A2N1N7I6_9GLOM|nr:hypothetical protein RhiirC2_712365 [Rhizophagus irregularis]
MSNNTSSVYTNIDKLPISSNEKTDLRIFFLGRDTTEVKEVLSTITKDEEKVQFLRKYVKRVQTSSKIKIANAFPNGLPYKKPRPFLSSSGLKWNYQLDKSLSDSLKENLDMHYILHQKENCREKAKIPLYLFISGAGTGKSRNASEFHETMIKCSDDDLELKDRLENSWVFHVSYENGTSLMPSEDPFEAVGARMLKQLLDVKLSTVIDLYEPARPWEVLELVAKYYSLELNNATVVMILDGLQNIMDDVDDGTNKGSIFYRTLTSIADLSLEDTFLITCCTATTCGPIENFLADTQRKRVYLSIASLAPPVINNQDVFEMNNPIINLLVSDCDGHGRALEILADILRTIDNINNCNVSNLMERIRNELISEYDKAFSFTSEESKQIIRMILTHQRLHKYQSIIKEDVNFTPDKICRTGMFRFHQFGTTDEGYLTMPYIWLWVMANNFLEIDDPQIRYWHFNDYSEHVAKEDKTLASGYCTWQNFEIFNANFRCMKSKIYEEGEIISVLDIHSGARLNGDISFKNHHLRSYISSHWVDSSSKIKEPTIQCEHVLVDVKDYTYCIINGVSAPYGDAFIRLDTTLQSANEVHQYKYYDENSSFSQDDYINERNKSASADDYFMFYITKNECNINLPDKSGIVDGKCWNEYFGAFAGRAYIFASKGPLNINEASYAQLQIADYVGPKTAAKIMKERKKKPFDGVDDAKKRLKEQKVSKKALNQFMYAK